MAQDPGHFRNTQRKPPPGGQIDFAHPLAWRLAACWLLNEGAGLCVNDLGPNRLHGTITGIPAWSGSERGPHLTFDGATNFIRAADSPGISPMTGDFTVESVVARTGTSTFRWIYTDDGSGGNSLIDLRDNNGNWSIRFQDSGASGVSASDPTGSVAGRYYHLVGTRVGGQVRLFVNGRQVDSASGSIATVDTSGASAPGIGCNNSNPTSGSWLGSIQHVRLWQRALSPAEVLWLYEEPYAMLRPTVPRTYAYTVVVAASPLVSPYNRAGKEILDRTIDLAANTLKVMLVTNAYAADPDHLTVDAAGADALAAEIGVTGYTGGWGGSGRQTLANKTITQDDTNDRTVFTADPVTWTSLAAGATVTGAILIKEGASNDTTSRLIAYYPLTPYPTAGNGYRLTWDANGMLNW